MILLRQRYGIILVVLAMVAFTLPVMACETPTPTPTPTPPPVFTCPEAPFQTATNLATAEGEVVGCVAVSEEWNAGTVNLLAAFTMADNVCLKSADVKASFNFDYLSWPGGNISDSQTFDGCPQTYTFSMPIDPQSVGTWLEAGTIPVIAHAVVETDGAETCTMITSDEGQTFDASSNPVVGSDSGSTPRKRGGKSVRAYRPANYDNDFHLIRNGVRFSFQKARWIWEHYQQINRRTGDIVDFTKPFTVAGKPTKGILWITSDGGYSVSVNGLPVGNHGLLSGWRNSELKESHVLWWAGEDHHWKSVEEFDISNKLVKGENALLIQTASKFTGLDCDGSNPDPRCSVPSGLIYEGQICSSTPVEKEAWVNSSIKVDWTGLEIKYFEYTLQGEPLVQALIAESPTETPTPEPTVEAATTTPTETPTPEPTVEAATTTPTETPTPEPTVEAATTTPTETPTPEPTP